MNSSTVERDNPSTTTPNQTEVGAIFAILGALILAGSRIVAVSGAPTDLGAVVIAAAGLYLFFPGIVALLWRNDLLFDLPLRRYRYRRGLLPFARWHEGRYDDFDHLGVTRTIPLTAGKKIPVWCVTAFWKQRNRPPFCLLGKQSGSPPRYTLQYKDRLAALVTCNALAQQLDLPVREETLESKPRSLLVGRNLVWLLLLLAVLNSYFGLIVWEDGWTDAAGNLYQREHALLRIDVVTVSPDGQRGYARNEFGFLRRSTQELALSTRGQAHAYYGRLRFGRPNPEHLMPVPPPGGVAAGIARLAVLRRQSDFFRMVSRWHETADMYAQVVELELKPPLSVRPAQGYNEALIEDLDREVHLYLMADDLSGYQQACATYLKLYGDGRNPNIANRVAWQFALAPNATTNYAPPLHLVALAIPQMQQYSHEVLNTQGLLLCRAHQYNAAIRTIKAGLKSARQRYASDYLALGIAHLGLGHRLEGRQWLKQACTEFEADQARDDTLKTGLSDRWTSKLETDVLSREAHSLLARAH
jgi:hypothetical protein